MSASLAVQKLLRAALAADPALAGIGMFDGVPAGAAAPYLTLGLDIVTDWSHKSGIGHEHRVQINVWDDAGGTARVKTLSGAVETVTRALGGERDGHRIAGTSLLRGFVAKDPDGWTRATLEFRIRTEQL